MPRKCTVFCVDCGSGLANRYAKRCRQCSHLLRAVHAQERNAVIPGPNPSGLCACGCGQRTSLSGQSSTKTGAVRGKPMLFIVGHWARTRERTPDYIFDPDTGCWAWRKKLTHGYAYVDVGGRTLRAARVYYERKHGTIPDGLTIDHLCRYRDCVNPDHLEAVTGTVNTRRRGSNKLSMDKAREIRTLSGTMTQKDIAARYGVSAVLVSRVITCHIWREE